MHHIYHTHGIILNSRNVGEANKIFTIYTKEIGLVRAVAQGIRLSKSKLRFALQDFSYAHIDLVRGKEVWRITSATSKNSFAIARKTRESLLFLSRTARLIERLCGGEEPNTRIFDDCLFAWEYLNTEKIDDSSRQALELYFVFRVLDNLGYVGDSKLSTNYLYGEFDISIVPGLLSERQSIVSYINYALKESHL